MHGTRPAVEWLRGCEITPRPPTAVQHSQGCDARCPVHILAAHALPPLTAGQASRPEVWQVNLSVVQTGIFVDPLEQHSPCKDRRQASGLQRVRRQTCARPDIRAPYTCRQIAFPETDAPDAASHFSLSQPVVRVPALVAQACTGCRSPSEASSVASASTNQLIAASRIHVRAMDPTRAPVKKD